MSPFCRPFKTRLVETNPVHNFASHFAFHHGHFFIDL